MNSAVRVYVRGAGSNSSVGLSAVFAAACAVLTSACVQGEPIPQDVIQRAEGVLLEGNTGPVAVAPSGSVTPLQPVSPLQPGAVAPSGSVAPVAPSTSASAFADNANPPILPEVNELEGAEFDEDVIPENAIPLDEYLAN